MTRNSVSGAPEIRRTVETTEVIQLLDLRDEIMLQIASHLDARSLRSFALTSREIHRILRGKLLDLREREGDEKTQCGLADCPAEIVRRIASDLDPISLLNFAVTSRGTFHASRDLLHEQRNRHRTVPTDQPTPSHLLFPL
mmetsp:Transcript_6193/g.12173  ORF Transcript_6193/g.12173 Transcript_6193/m.12173 type:complete len:141 (+) Transcript_6193:4945-5367(+)